jgi:hypothetical protein
MDTHKKANETRGGTTQPTSKRTKLEGAKQNIRTNGQTNGQREGNGFLFDMISLVLCYGMGNQGVGFLACNGNIFARCDDAIGWVGWDGWDGLGWDGVGRDILLAWPRE